jgi:GntR family transcriptional repressor for pyruvate dehydrogenase complex
VTSIDVAKPQRINLTQQCLRSVQEYILSHGLRPGDKLPSQQEWAEMLGVSVLVVREALYALQALGLVEIQHGRGIFVRSLEETDFLDFLSSVRPLRNFGLEEVIEARAMLELAVLESCIARATPETIRELEGILDEMRKAPPLPGEDSPLHKHFHQVMLRATGDRMLSVLGLPLLNTFWELGNMGRMHLTAKELSADMIALHESYLDAIKRRDFSRTRQLVDQHLLGLCSKYHVFPFPAVETSEQMTTLETSVSGAHER